MTNAGGFSAAAAGGVSNPAIGGFPMVNVGESSASAGFSLMQKPGAAVPGLPVTSGTLTQKCGISDIDEIRQAYAPLLSVVDNHLPSPTVDYIEPGGAKQINKSCELYCWLYSSINPNMRKSYDIHDIQRREVCQYSCISFYVFHPMK